MNLNKLTISQAHQGLLEKRFSAKEILDDIYKQIKEGEDLNVFVSLSEEEAYSQAESVDKKIASGEEISAIAGIPASLKDVVCTRGQLTTASSKILEDYRPPFDAIVAERLRAAGAVFVGKTNTDEFTCGASTETSYYGVTKNPVAPDRVSGGSSGGSAASVAADMSIYSIGTDTGGSIRQPASFCGVAGLKVTYGRVPRSGVISMASSWDTIGPFAKNVKDLAHVLQFIAGASEFDSTTPKIEVPDYLSGINNSLQGLKIGVPKEFFAEGCDQDVLDLVSNAINSFKSMGAELVEISLPTLKYAVACYYILTPSEVSANMSRYDGIRYGLTPKEDAKDLEDFYYRVRSEGFGEEMKRRIMIGTYALSAGYFDAFYLKAQKVRTLIIEDFKKSFSKCDVIMGPVSPFPAFKIGEKADDPLAMYLADVFTIPASAAGIPALSVNCGYSKEGLPVGLQIMAPQFEEAKLLNVGNIYEDNLSS